MPAITRRYIICDRCKKEWEDSLPSATMWMKFKSFNVKKLTYKDADNIYYLCQECEKEFANWFLNKKEGEN